MAYYLIDFENIRHVQGLNTLSSDDTVIFFYTKNSNDLSFALHREIVSSQANFKYFEGQNGSPNALDFQLSSYLGYLIGQFPEESFYIVSKDKGFENVIAFWATSTLLQLKIERIENVIAQNGTPLSKVPKVPKVPAQAAEKAPTPTLHDELKKNSCALQLKEADIQKVEGIVNQYKTKQAINNNLMKFFKNSEKVGKITKVLRPFLKDKK